MAAQRSQTTDDDHRVVPFRQRDLGASGRAPRPGEPPDPPNEAFSKYEGGEEREDTYRHRMVVNLAALAFTIVLALAGVWLAMQIADTVFCPADAIARRSTRTRSNVKRPAY